MFATLMTHAIQLHLSWGRMFDLSTTFMFVMSTYLLSLSINLIYYQIRGEVKTHEESFIVSFIICDFKFKPKSIFKSSFIKSL